MKEKILPHQKIRITRRKLKSLGACSVGLASVKHLLPITLSTNPDRNIAISKKVVGTYAQNNVFWPWVKSTVGNSEMWNEISDMDRLAYHTPGIGESFDVHMDTLPQMLAAMTDSLLRHKKFRPVGARK